MTTEHRTDWKKHYLWFCKINLPPEETSECKLEQRKFYSYVTGYWKQRFINGNVDRTTTALNSCCLKSCISMDERGKRKKEVKFLHGDWVSNSHPLFKHIWMTSCVKDLKPRKLCPVSSNTAIFLMCNLKLRMEFSFQNH